MRAASRRPADEFPRAQGPGDDDQARANAAAHLQARQAAARGCRIFLTGGALEDGLCKLCREEAAGDEFRDRYTEALRELIEAKREEQELPAVLEPTGPA